MLVTVFHSNDLKICIISGLHTSLSLLFVRMTTCPFLISYFCQYPVHFLAFVRVITTWHVLRLRIEEGGTMAKRCARSNKLWRRISSLDEWLLVSQEGLCSMEFVSHSIYLGLSVYLNWVGYLYFNTCTVYILLLCTMTNNCTIISQIITLLHVSTLSCHPQGACNQYLAKLHKYFKYSCWYTVLLPTAAFEIQLRPRDSVVFGFFIFVYKYPIS